jgi:hypothetical protein
MPARFHLSAQLTRGAQPEALCGKAEHNLLLHLPQSLMSGGFLLSLPPIQPRPALLPGAPVTHQ